MITNIEEAKSLKKQLEDKIASLVLSFETASGLTVLSVEPWDTEPQRMATSIHRETLFNKVSVQIKNPFD